MTEPTNQTGGSVLAAYVTSVLVEERGTKASLEGRGITLITSSGAFVTLVLAIAALVSDGSVNGPARVLLMLASVCFQAAAVMGVQVNRPIDYMEPTAASLTELVQENWGASIASAARAVAKSEAETLEAARKNNAGKAKLLHRGSAFRLAALIFVGLAGVAVLAHP